MTSHDYQLRLFNGDTGVVVAAPDDGHPRAKEHVRIIASRAALFAAAQRPIQRASGLRG